MGNEGNKGRANFLEVSRLSQRAEDMRERALDDMLTYSIDLNKKKTEYDRFIRKGLNNLGLSRKYIKEIMDFYDDHFS
ncbi:hypothetical protein J4225_00410 [Candidatus Pacearchaeota archaeon]|nr:hypothetical protein [uncultured archaeon]MBS3085132.1 hypothetical protein [Candidatus Pacearchaeota archaeon]